MSPTSKPSFKVFHWLRSTLINLALKIAKMRTFSNHNFVFYTAEEKLLLKLRFLLRRLLRKKRKESHCSDVFSFNSKDHEC